MAVFTKRRIDQRLQHLKQRLLDEPIHYRGDAQLAFAAIRFGDADATHRTWPVRAFHQLLPYGRPCGLQIVASLSYVHSVHPRCTFVRLHAFPRALHVLSRERLFQQRLPCVLRFMSRGASFIAGRLGRGFTPPCRDPPR